MKILVTGGAGYIGTSLVKKFANTPEVSEIIVYDNLSRGNYNLFLESELNDEKIKLIKGDILNTRKLETYVAEVDIIYHLAAFVLTPFSREDPHQFEQVNHWGTAELSYLVEKYAIPIVYLSSASVYGLQDKKMSKKVKANPTTHYGISKLQGEKMIKRLNDLTDVYIVRSGNVYGYNKSLRFDAVINKFIFDAHFNNRITIEGTGKQRRPFIHIDTLTNFLSKVPFDDNIKSGLYDLVSRNMSVNNIYQDLKEVFRNLEAIYLSQDLKLGSLEVDLDPDLPKKFSNDDDFVNEIVNFKENFAFKPKY